jgi:DNA (cytosine-5)-methyltransferase 1
VENVPALLTGKGKRWDRAPVGRVLGDLAEAGYDAEWACLSAREFGAPHLRKRAWIVAYPARDAEAGAAAKSRSQRQRARAGCAAGRAGKLPDADRDRCAQGVRLAARAGEPSGSPNALRPSQLQAHSRRPLYDADGGRHSSPQGQVRAGRHCSINTGWWATEPDVGRVAHGVPARVDRLAALGNALLPQIAEWIGRRILEHETQAKAGRA